MSDTLIILTAVIICTGIYISYREKVERDIKRQNWLKCQIDICAKSAESWPKWKRDALSGKCRRGK